MIRIGLHPKAGLDLSAITGYYRREAGRDVAERFIAEFRRCAEFLHYVLHSRQVYILSLAHQRRAPEHILERL